MEGEQIIVSLKDGGRIEPLLNGIEKFYQPVAKANTKLTASTANKYGVFAMKALRVCIQRLNESKPGSPDLAGILQISERSYECVCKARKHIETVPLALEKLLFHTMAQAVNKRLLSDAQRIASFLYGELSKSRSQFMTDSGVDNEYDTIVKQAFNQLWKACLELEQSSQAQASLKYALILNVRLQGLQFLFLTNYESSWIVERALRAAVDFDQKSSKIGSDQDQFNAFLTTVLNLMISNAKSAKVDKSKDGDSNKQTAAMFKLGIQAIKYTVRSLKLDQALEVCDQLSKFSESKRHNNQDGLYGHCLVLIKSALRYKQHVANKSSTKSTTSEMDSIADTVWSVSSNISKVIEKSTLSSSVTTCVLESCEIFKKCFEPPVGSDGQVKSISVKIPSVLYESMYAVMMQYVAVLQIQKEQLLSNVKGNRQEAKSQNQQIQRNVNRHLGVLDFLSSITLDLIKSDKQDGDDTKVEGYISKAVKLCNKTKDVIDDVASGGGGSLSTTENRWFGCTAYNVGLVCYRRKSYDQSALILEIACQQLQTWCFDGNKLDLDKVKKVQLLTRYEFLTDSQRKAGQHLQAMNSVVKCLWDVCSHMTDHVMMPCIESWVKAKRDALSDEANEDIQSRTLLDALKEYEGSIDGDHRDFISTLLKKELQAYKAARHDTIVEQHSVVCDLLNLNSDDDSKLAYCHALVEQAQLLRIRNFESDKSASECCSEAIDMLSELVKESSSSKGKDDKGLVAFDILATAYFWMYVCQMEEIQLSNANSKTTESPDTDTKPTKSEGGVVSKIAYTLGMEHSNMKYLDMALGIWADLLCNGFKADVFHELSVSSQCLKLMASLYDLSQRPLQQIQSLHLLSVISTATSNTPQSVYVFCQLCTTLCHMGEIKLAEHVMRKAEEVVEKAGNVESDGDDSLSRNLKLTLVMTKAEYLLYSGQFDSFQSKLGKLQQSQASERRTYNSYLHYASIKHLQATCMATNPEVMTPDLCPERHAALELAVEALKTRMGVCSNLLGEYFCSSSRAKDGSKVNNTSLMENNTQEEWYDQWSILSDVLQSLLQVGQLYYQQGSVREAECYLHEGLVIANQYLLPRRCAEFSIQLSKIYTMKGYQCQAQLAQMKQFVDYNKETKVLHETKGTAKTKKAPRRIPSKASVADSDDEDFIQSKRLSMSEFLASDGGVSSPSLKSQTVRLPEYHKHDSDCGCESCVDIVLHRLDLRYIMAQAKSSAMEGDLLDAISEIESAKKFSVWVASHDDKRIQDGVKCLTDSNEKTGKACCKKNKNSKINDGSIVAAQFHDPTIFDVILLKAYVLLQQNKPQRVQQCVDEGLALFAKNASPVIIPPRNKAELQFYKIVANVSQQGCDMFSSVWCNAQNQAQASTANVDDLTSMVGKLDLNVASGARSKSVSGKHNVGWVDRMNDPGRPEVARKDLITPAAKIYSSSDFGIFCEGDTQGHGPSSLLQTPQAPGPKQAVRAKTKKGVLSYSIKKKSAPSKRIPDGASVSRLDSESVFSLDNDVFDFDSPSVGTKKGKSTRKKSAKSVSTKSAKSRLKSESKVTFAESNQDDLSSETKDLKQVKTNKGSVLDDVIIDSEKEATTNDISKSKTKASKSTDDLDDHEELSVKRAPSKRSTASKTKKKPVFELSESDADPDVQSVLPKGRRGKSAKKGEEEGELVVKPKARGRRKKVEEPSIPDVDEAVPTKPVRQRRGRKANIENARAEDDDLVFDSVNMIMEASSILPIDTPEDIGDISASGFSDLDVSFDATSTSNTSPMVTIGSARCDMLLEDIDEIEIPRAGPDSEEEETVAIGRRKKKMMGKNPGARRRGAKTKDVDEEDAVEIPRTCTQLTEEGSSKQKMEAGASVKQTQGTMLASELSPVITQLEDIYNTIKCSASLILYRQVCHMLALCYGDQDADKAVYYLNEAMSVTLRHKKVSSLTKKIKKLKKASDLDVLSDNLSKMSLIPDNDRRKKKSSSKKDTPLSEIDILEEGKKMFTFHDQPSPGEGSIVQEMLDVLPDGWTVCSLSVVSTSVNSTKVPNQSDFLVVSRLAKNKETVLHKIPLHANDFGFSKSLHHIFDEFDALMLENRESMKETDKKVWWSCRQALDEHMQTLTKDMENLFGYWKGILQGQSKECKHRKRLALAAKEFKTAVETRCDISIDQHLCECLLASSYELNKRELNSLISSISRLSTGSEEHTQLASVFKKLATNITFNQVAAKLLTETDDGKHPVILVLDKQIQQLPWENMPSVRGHPMCRMPSLHFIASHLKSSTVKESVLSHGVDTNDAFFVLNPSNDLANTQKTFQKWFEKDNGWKGVVARAPTKEEYMAALTDHNLFVYCGHGNGRDFLTGDDIQRLSCHAATLLIGCSSGKLHVNGNLEANGMALNYLLSECPCVVANLWDVTDRDIDRFLEVLLKAWLASDQKTSLPDFISQSRQACKLQYLIGCSPVVYGLPVQVKK